MTTRLFEYIGDNPSPLWGATNDGVMGGLSQGGAQLGQEGMLFSGDLSLENNGGFSSIYAEGDMDLSAFEGIRLRVLGDGRTYQLRIQTDALYREWRRVSFRKEFTTTNGEWIEVFLPFDELRQSWRGRELSGHVFDAAKIERIGIMLADKQPGRFALKVAWIDAADGLAD